MRPNYLVIGAQKCATSTLCDLLARHPDVFMTEPKEPYFFSHDEVWARGLVWYESLFAGAAGTRAVGEGSTTYTMRHLYPNAAERLREHVPDAKLIYIVRNPLERTPSHWVHMRSRGGREKRPFAAALREAPEYLDNSMYLRQIDVYRRWWPDERILVLFFEDFVKDKAATMRRCFEFLGVDPSVDVTRDAHAKNVSAGSREDTPLLGPLRRLPLFERLRDAAPRGVREALRRTLKKPTAKPEWDEESRAYAIERLREDSHAFLERYGKERGFWGY